MSEKTTAHQRTKGLIVVLYDAGMSPSAIAQHLNVGIVFVRMVLKQHKRG